MANEVYCFVSSARCLCEFRITDRARFISFACKILIHRGKLTLPRVDEVVKLESIGICPVKTPDRPPVCGKLWQVMTRIKSCLNLPASQFPKPGHFSDKMRLVGSMDARVKLTWALVV